MEGDQTRKKLFIFTLSTATAIIASSIVKTTIPSKIGPAEFGNFYTYENISISVFAFANFGLEQITRSKRIVSDEKIEKIYNEALFIRFLLCLVIFTATYLTKNNTVSHTLIILLFWQLFFTQNSFYSSILQRNEKIIELSALSIISKVLFLLCFFLFESKIQSSTEFAFLIALFEAFRTTLILFIFRKNSLKIPIKITFPRNSTVVLLLPFLIQHVGQQLYAKTNGILLPFLVSNKENAYYGAANNIILLGIIFAPAVNAVFMPILSRVENHSERIDIADKSTYVILPILIAFSVFLFCFSPLISTTVFGSDYRYSSPSLKALSPTIPITYLSIIYAIDAMNNGKIKSITKINLKSLTYSMLISTFLIIIFSSTNRPGLPSFGASISIIICESIAARKICRLSTLKTTNRSLEAAFISLSASTFFFGILSTQK